MHRPTVVFPFLVFLLAFCSYASTAQHKKTHRARPIAIDRSPVVAQEQAAPPPPPPPTPEQGPSSPPDVSFQGGELTITARNSTMGDVLNAVKQKTGAAVDMPVAPSERVVGRFGPGTPRDVMAQLLNGSHYDYVLLGSPSDPGALRKVVLMARANGPEPAEAPPQPQVANQPFPAAVPDIETDQSSEDNSPVMFQQQEMPQPEEEAQPEQPQFGQPVPGQPVVKTPEQLLRELQQQQQQQQMQNAQPPQQQ